MRICKAHLPNSQCDCKNFSRRKSCFKCKRNKTDNCRIVPVIKQKATGSGYQGNAFFAAAAAAAAAAGADVVAPTTSLMVKGSVIPELNDAVVSVSH